MDKKLKICITATTISDMTRAYMAVCRQRKDEIKYHEKENLKFELDGCLIKFIFPGNKDFGKYDFDQIIVAGGIVNEDNMDWINRNLKCRLITESGFPGDKQFVTVKNSDPFWNRPSFPYGYDGEP